MSTSRVQYLGNLRTENTHIKSDASYHTDAPVDNNGQGEAFSPTDTVATALANCMMTIMGIKAAQMDVSIYGATALVTKTMASDPRRISKIEIDFQMPFVEEEKSKTILENAASTCPVHYSLHPDIEKVISFTWA